MKRNRIITAILSLALVGMVVYVVAEEISPPDRDRALKAMKDGNWKDAYEEFSRLALDPKAEATKTPEDFQNALNCLQQLNRFNEADDFREKVIEVQAKNWRLLVEAARSYQNDPFHAGYIIAGKFNRGYHRGGDGKYVYTFERDRIRALQLMQQAMGAIEGEKDGGAVGGFYWELAQMMLGGRGSAGAWRLGYLTDLSKLPDYEDTYNYYDYYGGSGRGAPVNPDGTPVLHYTPKSWKDAKTDGQRWRWCLLQAAENNNNLKGLITFHFAEFLQNQFGPQTMAEYGRFFSRFGGPDSDDETRKDESGVWALHTLGEDETIAKLANGIKRFKLPDEFNYIKIFRQMWDEKLHGDLPANELCGEFENRRQYPKAAELWKKNIKDFGAGHEQWKQKRLDQIVGNWGQFESILTQPAGKGATVEFRFRNGTRVDFEAWEIDVPKLLADIKDYLKSNPKQLDWEKIEPSNIGYRLVTKNQKQYLKAKPAQWGMDLKPRPGHFDKLVTIATPLQKAGAYLLTGTMADGNTSRIIIWIADTTIVNKGLDGKTLYFVADAVSGKPIPKANVEFFGYRQDWKENIIGRGGHHEVYTRNFAEFTDENGMLVLKPEQFRDKDFGYNWLSIATTEDGRLAYMGFSGIWTGSMYDAEYNATKTFLITDRPVYRPLQTAKFKFWTTVAKYDRDDASPYAGKKLTVRVNNPRGEKFFEKEYAADEYGGLDGEFELPKDATLGVYHVMLLAPGENHLGGGQFRIEEYKKPEFEVKVEAPKDPVMLGQKIKAEVQAKYYFGAPVAEGKVKYKVLRTSHTTNWYPVAWWDWFYEPGYWWFAYDYVWYPGWGEWGCKRPMPVWWWQWHPRQPPEVVAEGEAEIGKDGTYKIEIDTSLAKAVHGDTDHRYEVTAEVTDLSRRVIVGQGKIIVARKPFKVYACVNRGHFRTGDVIEASFNAQTPDSKPVKGTGELRLMKIGYDKDGKPVEQEVQKWALDTNEEGVARQQIKADQPGQYRLSYKVTSKIAGFDPAAKAEKDPAAKADEKPKASYTVEGGYVFCIIGQGFDGRDFRFNDIELVTDKKEYKPDDKVKLMVNTNQADSTVLLFVRPTNGCYQMPKLLQLKGKSVTEEIEVVKKDMPNFFIEGLTVSGGKIYTEVREVIVPPESRVLDVKVSAAAVKPPEGKKDEPAEPNRFKPAQKAKVSLKLVDPNGEPYSGSIVLSMYDKAVEYISGGSNVPEIKAFFWKWRRHHHPQTHSSLGKGGWNLLKEREIGMSFLGVFGQSVAMEEQRGQVDDLAEKSDSGPGMKHAQRSGSSGLPAPAMEAAANGFAKGGEMLRKTNADAKDGESGGGGGGGGGDQPQMVQPTVRTKFADTAYWNATIVTAKNGQAEIELDMPENLTTWKTCAWAMGAGTRVGQGSIEVVTAKDLIVRLQAPRFFTQKDEVVISANVHNYLKSKKSAKAELELVGDCLELLDKENANSSYGILGPWAKIRSFEIDANDEKRIDWLVKVVKPGEAIIRVKALTDEESDAMEMKFPVYIHGILKTESFSGVIRPDKDAAKIDMKVPAERLPEQSRLEIRYSPTLAGAMVDALPYMVEYPYGCTEQTLNKFLPTVITQKVLLDMGLDLKDIRDKQTNLNAQEIGDDKKRMEDWKRLSGKMRWDPFEKKFVPRNPVFDPDEVKEMVKVGLERLTSMQCSDGGWGWFSGWGERSYPHTTAVVVHGLQTARACDIAIVPNVIDRGVKWLQGYQAEQVRRLKLPKDHREHKACADDMDAYVFMVLTDEIAHKKGKIDDAGKDMLDFLYRDRNGLAIYTKSMLGLSCHKLGDNEKRDMLKKNVEQFLMQDEENQTAYLNLPDGRWWWCWYWSEYEAHAYYIKLLAAVEPKSQVASRMVKYLLNNRRHATYWNSTRDTAVVIEAFADYIKATGEDKPDMTLSILIDGKEAKQVKINKDNIFSFDNKLVLTGKDVADGKHTVELKRDGKGPVYFNAYLTNFTLEDPISKAGLEIKVQRKYYKLEKVEATVKVEGSSGQAVDQKVEKYKRVPIPGPFDENFKDAKALKSGDLVEIELEIDSKNDYEYIILEDLKPAGCEPVEVRSGYNGNEMHAYVEFRDERVVFFVRALARGKHSVSYRMRAEIPGKFSALPTKASAMYAPELKANSDEMKLGIKD